MGIFDTFKFGKKETDAAGQAPLSLPDVIAPAAIGINPRSLTVSGKFSRVFFVVSYPRILTDSWLEPIFNLEREMDVTIMVHPIDTTETLKKFQKKVAEVESQINEREEKGMVRDPQLEAAYRNLEDLRDRLQQADEKLFNVGLYIAIYADTETELNKSKTISRVFSTHVLSTSSLRCSSKRTHL
jgi:hypothetical protein